MQYARFLPGHHYPEMKLVQTRVDCDSAKLCTLRMTRRDMHAASDNFVVDISERPHHNCPLGHQSNASVVPAIWSSDFYREMQVLFRFDNNDNIASRTMCAMISRNINKQCTKIELVSPVTFAGSML